MNIDVLTWIKQIGSDDYDTATDLALDGAGNIYITGYTQGALEAGNQAGNADVWLAKYDDDGNQQWLKQLGSPDNETANALATDRVGNVYLAGYTEGELEVGQQAGGGDIWLAKYDGDGNQQWLKQLGSTHHEDASSLATDSAGNIFLTGCTEGELETGKQSGGADIWLAKYDSDGNQQWLKQLGSSDHEASNALATDHAGNVYLAGHTEGELEAGQQAGGGDAWLAKYDGDGNQQWLKQLGSADDESATGLATDEAGNVYLSGYTYGELEAGQQAGDADVWLAKYNSDGNQQWLKQLGSSASDSAWSMATDADGSVYLTGCTEGELETGRQANSDDIWLAKYDNDGNQQWLKQLGSAKTDSATALEIDQKGDLYLAGGTEGTLEAGKQADHADVWLAKYAGPD